MNVLGGDPNLQHDVWQIPVLALAEDDVCTLPDGEARRRNGDLVRAGLDGGEAEEPAVVRDRLASRVCSFVCQHGLGVWNHRVARVIDGAAERTARVLAEGERWQPGQDRNEQPRW